MFLERWALETTGRNQAGRLSDLQFRAGATDGAPRFRLNLIDSRPKSQKSQPPKTFEVRARDFAAAIARLSTSSDPRGGAGQPLS